MSRQDVKRCHTWGVFGAALALSAAVLGWDAGRSPAAACATTPCNNGLTPQQQKQLALLEAWLKEQQRLYPDDGVSYQETSAFTNFMQTGQFGSNAQGPANLTGAGGHLGMYVNGSPDLTGWGVAGGGDVLHSNGFRLTDSAGAFAPGSLGPSVRDVGGGGGIYGNFDANPLFWPARWTKPHAERIFRLPKRQCAIWFSAGRGTACCWERRLCPFRPVHVRRHRALHVRRVLSGR